MSNGFDLGGGGNSFPFDNIGDSVTGRIVHIEEVQQTDLQTGQPAVWDSGQPKMMVRVELQTELRDPTNIGDDGKRSVYLKGSRKPESQSSMAAALAAVTEATGGRSLQPGGTFTLTYIGDGVPKQRGHNAPKFYSAAYQPPAVDLGGDAPAPQQAAAPVAQAPQAYAQPVAQQAPAPQPVAQAAPAPAGPPQLSPEQAAAFAQFQAAQAAAAQQPAGV